MSVAAQRCGRRNWHRCRSYSRKSPLLHGLLAWWRLDEASGIRGDSSGRGKHLTPSAAIGSAAGKIGSAASFVTDGRTLVISQALFSSGPFSVSAWVFSDEIADSYAIFSQGTATANRQVLMITSAPQIRWFVGETYPDDSLIGGSWAEDVWMHLVGTYDGATAKIYHNGSEVASEARTADYTGVDRAIIAGDPEGAGAALSGRIDLCGVWSRALSAVEVALLYNGGNGRDHPF